MFLKSPQSFMRQYDEDFFPFFLFVFKICIHTHAHECVSGEGRMWVTDTGEEKDVCGLLFLFGLPKWKL